MRRLTPFLCLLLVACSGSARQPAEAPRPRQSSNATVATGTTTGDDDRTLAPAPAPATLVVVGRVRDPGGFLGRAGALLGTSLDPQRHLERTQPELAAAVSMNAPMDLALLLAPGTTPMAAPEGHLAVSVGLKVGIAELVAQPGVRRIAPGVYRVPVEGAHCAVARASGAVPVRLVCAEQESALEAVLPYMVTTLPTESLGTSDVHVELRAGAVRQLYGKLLQQGRSLAVPFVLSQLGLDDPRFDRALGNVLHAVADELLLVAEDLDTLTVEVGADASAGALTARVTLRFSRDRAWSLGMLADAARRVAGPPADFFMLPRDAETASFGSTFTARRMRVLKRPLVELLDSALAVYKVPASTRGKAREFAEGLLTLEGTSWSASGSVTPVRPAPSTDEAQRREAARQSLGWTLVGLNVPVEKLRPHVVRLVSLYEDPALRAELTRRFGGRVLDKLPVVTTRPARGVKGTTWSILPPNGKPQDTAGTPYQVTVVLAGEGRRSYLVVAAEEDDAVAVIARTAMGGGLVDREGLAPLKGSRALAGGFWTVGSLARSSSSGRLKPAELPHRGATPIPWTVELDRGGGGVAVVATLVAPHSALEDLAAWTGR